MGKIYETQFLMDEKSLRVNYQGEDKCTALLKYSAEIRYIKSVSLKIAPLQYIAIYYYGSIFNETDFRKLIK